MTGPALRRPSEAGMTLIEVMVVLAIIGVVAGATVLGIGAATRAPSAESEARRLAAQVQLAADDAMVTDRMLALEWDSGGYRIVVWDGQGWTGGDGEPYRRHRLPAGMGLKIIGAGSPAILGIDGTGLPFAARLANAGDAWSIGYDGLKAIAIRVPKA